ncbi:C4-dicarboxylate ABC transporter permease [Oceanobacillus oncorhynchi subsp. incaldanensis]|uniref:TRAP transporter large permease n=1 Tax=Oceanobacillus oncorhynchi TaxID=545501 RepID=UPI001B2007DE|nr:TRAP transporter large permease [Oceanobacillus oncorhynchi]GIO20352.1 C4-dicarboxylate ABC transporter permease [Oceanobacillus oncorhynchi subsp. incaldanensis]
MVAPFLGSLIVFLLISMPVAVALGLASVVGIIIHPALDLTVVPQRIIIALNSFPLMAIPFFILAGGLMQNGGVAQRLVDFASTIVGHITGGLAMTVIITSLFFAAISGSGTATVLTIGSILVPGMIAKGYESGFISSTVSVSGALGIIIPPSIPLILYGITAQVSVTEMFLAGIVPGVLLTMAMLIYAFVISKKNGFPKEEKASLSEVAISFVKSLPAILMPVLVLGGIYGGIFTPTEASVVAVVYGLLAGLFYKELTLKKIYNTLTSSAISTAIIMIIIGTSGLFSYYIQMIGIPAMLTEFMMNITTNPYIFLLIINLLLLIVGMFIEGSAAILILTPLLLPIATSVGVDPIHFGIVMIVNLAIGLCTPPVGLNLFAASKISGVSISKLSMAVIPYIIVMLLVTLLVSFLPIFSLWFNFL